MKPNLKALAGYTLLVGKEPNDASLMVCTVVNGKSKAARIGLPGSVPNTVSRCMAAQNVAHLKIEIDKDRVVRLTNLKQQNVTFVNGIQIYSKAIDPETDKVTLGANNWPLDLDAVLAEAVKLVPKVAPEFPADHLEKVWEEYKTTTDSLKRTQNNLGQLRGGAMIFTMGSGVLVTLLKSTDVLNSLATAISLVFPLIGVGIIVYCTIKSKKLDMITKTNEATERFQDQYVCPNPECRHFLGNQPYKILRQNKGCPYCKATFIY